MAESEKPKTADDALATELDPNERPEPITFELPGLDGAEPEQVTIPAPLTVKCWYLIHKNLFVKLDPNDIEGDDNTMLISMLLDGIVTDTLKVVSYATGIPVKRLEQMTPDERERVETALTEQVGKEMRNVAPFFKKNYIAGQEKWGNLIGMMTAGLAGGKRSSGSRQKSAAVRGKK